MRTAAYSGLISIKRNRPCCVCPNVLCGSTAQVPESTWTLKRASPLWRLGTLPQRWSTWACTATPTRWMCPNGSNSRLLPAQTRRPGTTRGGCVRVHILPPPWGVPNLSKSSSILFSYEFLSSPSCLSTPHFSSCLLVKSGEDHVYRSLIGYALCPSSS